MMPAHRALQFIHVPHRPVHSDAEINNDLVPALTILLKLVSSTFAASIKGSKADCTLDQQSSWPGSRMARKAP